MESSFNNLSWLVIVVYLVFTTWLGARLSGRQATIKDFFLGGRTLPWYAVCGSIIATELSAMTLVGAPAFLWAATGNMAYAVLGIGTIIARVIVGFWFVPRFYDEEIYSPYEYIGNRLGERARRTTSFLFMFGGMMGQGTRVLLTAVVLNVVTGMEIITCIWLVGVVAVLWTWLGGIQTVIWTDLIQFLIFTFSAIITLVIVAYDFPPSGIASPGAILDVAREAGKLRWLDLSIDPRLNYTLIAGLIGTTIGGLANYGTDQMLVQRLFCCRSQADARKALIWSSVSQILMLICLFVGVCLWAYYQRSGLPGVPAPEELAQINENSNRLLPVFIKYRVHWFLGGLMVAGIFAAAISSLDSILAALAQQSLETVRKAGRAAHLFGGDALSETAAIRLSRTFILFWGAVLCAMATLFYIMASNATLLIELALSVVGYAWGGILGAFLMALIPSLRRRAAGIEWAAILSVMTIFSISHHELWAQFVLIAGALALLFAAPLGIPRPDRVAPVRAALASLTFIIGLLLILPAWRDGQQWAAFGVGLACFAIGIALLAWLNRNDPLPPLVIYGFSAAILFVNRTQFIFPGDAAPTHLTLGWPWFIPLGTTVMLAAALLICSPRTPPA